MALAALGLYGVLAFFVTQRLHEIGIRVALGASGGSVLRLIVHRGIILVGLGTALGIAVAMGATRLLEGMLFQVSTTDPTTFVGVTGFFFPGDVGRLSVAGVAGFEGGSGGSLPGQVMER